MNTIKFGQHDLPCYPFIWKYDSYPLNILSAIKHESVSDTSIPDVLNKIVNITNFLITFNLLKRYKIDFYEVNQELPENYSGELLNISFHSWYFNAFSNLFKQPDVMTSEKFKTDIFSGIFINDEARLSPGTENNILKTSVNTCELRSLSVHNMELSPQFDNSFSLTKVGKDKISFVSVVFCPKFNKKACITLHNLFIKV